MSASSTLGTRAVGRRDLGAALALAVATTLLYAATAQTRMHGDASWMVEALVERREVQVHVFAGWVYRMFTGVFSGVDPIRAAYWLSHLFAGVGCGAVFLLCRAFGAGRRAAAAATVLVAVSPALWFFATTVEVHALHFGVVATFACCVVFAPWRRPLVALALVCALFPLVYVSHQMSVWLGFGWVLLARASVERLGGRMRWREALLGVGPLLLFVLAAAIVWVGWLRSGRIGWDVGHEQRILEAYTASGYALEMAWRGWLLPLGCLVPLGIAACFRSRGAPPVRALAAAFLVPPLLFLLFLYPVPERGGFFLGSVPFLALLISVGGGRRWTGLVLGACLLQAVWARTSIDAWDRGFDPRARAERLEQVLGERGVLLVADHRAPRISLYLPGWIEVSLLPLWTRGGDELVAEGVREALRRGPVAVDLSYRVDAAREGFTLDEVPRDPFWAELDALWDRWDTTVHEDPFWPLLRVSGLR